MHDLRRWGVPEVLWPVLCEAASEHGGPILQAEHGAQVLLYLPPRQSSVAVPLVLGARERRTDHEALLCGLDVRWQRVRWRNGHLSIGSLPEGWVAYQVLAAGAERAHRLEAHRQT